MQKPGLGKEIFFVFLRYVLNGIAKFRFFSFVIFTLISNFVMFSFMISQKIAFLNVIFSFSLFWVRLGKKKIGQQMPAKMSFYAHIKMTSFNMYLCTVGMYIQRHRCFA
jgi:hypothetical protein